MSGSMRSRMTQSQPPLRMMATPSSPLPVATTSKPSNSRASRRPRTMSGSSSTMSTRFLLAGRDSVTVMNRLHQRALGGNGVRDGQIDQEGGALARVGVDGDRATVGLGDVLDERQSDAGAADVGSPRRLGPVEALEDLALLLARDARALIADDEAQPVADARQVDRDLALAVLDCVLEEVEEQERHRVLVDGQGRQAGV